MESIIYQTIIVEVNNSGNLIEELHKIGLAFWIMHKNGKIRLRIKAEDYKKVIEVCNKINVTIIENVWYEPEVCLFGGDNSIHIVHDILCEVENIRNLLPLEHKKNQPSLMFYIIYMIKSAKLDQFEEWDLWKKIAKHRRLSDKNDIYIILKQLPELYRLVSMSDENTNIINDDTILKYLENIGSLIGNIKELYYQGKLTRGFRGIMSSIIIFSMNILNISAQYQVGLINGIVILKNPDFRGEIENAIY